MLAVIDKPDPELIVALITLSSNINTVFLEGLATTAAVDVSDVLTNACVVISLTDLCTPELILKCVSVPYKLSITIDGKSTVPES